MTVDEIINHKDFDRLVYFAYLKFRKKIRVDVEELAHEVRLRIFRFFNQKKGGHLTLSTIIVSNTAWSLYRMAADRKRKYKEFNDNMVCLNEALSSSNSNEQEVADCWEHITKGLDEREISILEMRRDGHTLQEIGKSFGISRERVRQLLANIEEKKLR